MKTTYFLTHESINCPICGKLLRESKSYDEVACSDPQCRFNDSPSKDKAQIKNPFREGREKPILEVV